MDIEPGLVVQGDPHLPHQGLDNLLGNAGKFSGQQAQVHITFSSAADAHGKTVYAIKDNGTGFDMAHPTSFLRPSSGCTGRRSSREPASA